MTYTFQKSLTLEEFLIQYGNNPCYELIDGELRDRSPTGLHEQVSGKLAGYLFVEILRNNLGWTIPKNCLIRPDGSRATALRPDVIVLDEAALTNEPLWKKQPVLTGGGAVRLVVEVVSTNWQDDYARKVEEYAALGIPEYWIVDYLGLGGIAFIGKPKQPTFTVCQLVQGDYRSSQYRLREAIVSPSFPELQLCLNDFLPDDC